MSRQNFTGPKLPKVLLDKVDGGQKRNSKSQISRKDRRKAERQAPKANRIKPPLQKSAQRLPLRKPVVSNGDGSVSEEDGDEDDGKEHNPTIAEPRPDIKNAEVPKSILKKKTLPPATTVDNDADSNGDESDSTIFSATENHGRSGSPSISRRAAKAGMADNDDEIAALERKLGLKRGGDTYDEQYLLGGLGDDSEDEERGIKRKRPEDSKWLRDKRLKAAKEEVLDSESNEGEPGLITDEDTDDAVWQNPFSDDEMTADDFDGLSSEDGPAAQPKRRRENPYVAPTVDRQGASVKYVPPSLRKAAIANDSDSIQRLRRQIQGQLNRLSEANILSILQAIEQIYEKNARQYVTETLVDLLVSRISDPSVLSDTFLILHAGFSAALYKVVGIDFGAQLLERLVAAFDACETNPGKESLNILAFLSNLYSFQVVGSGIMFDYVRTLLALVTEGISSDVDDQTEKSTELLLRIVRISGVQLRQDDPSALKDIVLLLQRSVTKADGGKQVSVRTKFMIETINDLKNNRMKTGANISSLTAEHTTRMKKTIGTLSKSTEPLRITLADIRDSDKKGKWWLVGASYQPGTAQVPRNQGGKTTLPEEDAGYESETPGKVSLHKLARQQGMNTDVRKAIFVSLLSGLDFQDANERLLKLHLTSKQKLEVPRVLLHCAGSEHVYNHYYTLVARALCEDTHIKKAFRSNVWNLLGKLGNGVGMEDDEQDAAEMSTRRVVNLAKLYATLFASSTLSIGNLKTIEFANLSEKEGEFTEVLLTTMLLQVHQRAGQAFETTVKDIFIQAQTARGMIQGLQYYVGTILSKAELANTKVERKIIKRGCRVALAALEDAAEGAPIASEDDSDTGSI